MAQSYTNMPLGGVEIGGGIVRRRFSHNGEYLLAGQRLSAETINRMHNGRALITSGRIVVYPKVEQSAAPDKEPRERHVVGGIGGRWDVIEGRKINERHLTREEAERLAAE
jgi:hypothetical protein